MNKGLYFIRHGEVEYPLDEDGRKLVYPPETPLSQLGREQMTRFAKTLKEEGARIEALFVSPFTRTRESAEILQKGLGVENISILDDLKDVYPNSWTGHALEEYGTIEGDIYSHPLSSEQETLEHLLNRARSALRYVLDRTDYETVGLVSHGDLLSGADWIMTHKEGDIPSYIEMKNNFYLQKGQVAEYSIDKELKLAHEVRFISVPEVDLSVETFRGDLRNS